MGKSLVSCFFETQCIIIPCTVNTQTVFFSRCRTCNKNFVKKLRLMIRYTRLNRHVSEEFLDVWIFTGRRTEMISTYDMIS